MYINILVCACAYMGQKIMQNVLKYIKRILCACVCARVCVAHIYDVSLRIIFTAFQRVAYYTIYHCAGYVLYNIWFVSARVCEHKKLFLLCYFLSLSPLMFFFPGYRGEQKKI